MEAEIAALGDLGSLARVLDAMPDLVMLVNRQRQILFGNLPVRTYAATRKRGEPQGKRLGELLECREAATAPNGCGTGEACRTCGAVQAILAGLAGHPARLECRIVNQSHDALDFRVIASPFHWHGTEYALVVATDISDLKRREALERIFFHDILNVAVGIFGLADILADDVDSAGALSPMLRHSSEALVNEIRSQQQLVAAEKYELRVIPTQLMTHAALDGVTKIYRHQWVADGKAIALHPNSEDFPFTSDRALVERIMGNLLKNALEASGAGDKVSLGASAVEDATQLWVHNPGVIPKATQLQLFRRNFTTKGTGRGLGTYGARLLAERYLGGHVTFASTPEAGTTFTLRLPL